MNFYYNHYSMENQDFKLLIGLGNPGEKYRNTYHNIGCLMIDNIIGKQKSPAWRDPAKRDKKFEFIKINSIVFAKSLTFMNTSGETVQQALRYFKLNPLEMLVIHDDADIELGKFKLAFGQSSAGHKGIESIISSLKTKDFWRLRIGIRRLPSSPFGRLRRAKAENMVLKKISKKDLEILQATFSDIKTHLLSALL